ncbi:hypothetical protein C7434_1018 [Pantoea sp. PNA 14-12]|uniref:Uncharacterized protein n=1 Tax=Pantoea stewartii TaxID=66269 RepID=A0AB34VCA2_9GAMM|nr:MULTISPECIES: hypothetical protein [Pantoea]KKW52406.1 hypothetical protein XB02_00575 [Pantoea ananatis]KGD82547.1 hypothetical protein HA47_17405 [Pantoea stewartii subsp. indologenes]KHE02190.1 hypothetical protein NL54_05480 [Pantoea stewartii]KHN61827.1 hypothetical protein OI73_13240 [Pantoea stewartii]KTS28107.1 hypothetical protein NS381_12140 [Pantoea stewartii]
MKHDRANIGEEIHALLGRVVSGILQPGKTLTLQEIIGALHQQSLQTSCKTTRQTCEEAIRILAHKLH